MLILSIESSCDETAVALIENGIRVIADITYSQVPIHATTGGVVPEVASREHIVKIIPCIRNLLEDNNISIEDIEAIAVTSRPGLIGALLIGVETAKALAYAWSKPLIPVYHIWGHIYSVYLDRDIADIHLPAIVLTVSGGHNDIYYFKNHNHLQNIGKTLDDAAGEAFDKVAKMLGLPYPGGPYISQLANEGEAFRHDFPQPMLDSGDYNFSFSGLKTAVKYAIQKVDIEKEKAHIAASFQEAICQTLAKKVIQAAKTYNVQSIFVVGGVSANDRLRDIINEHTHNNYSVLYPAQKKYCVDNACMIGSVAYFQYKNTVVEGENIFSIAAQSN